MQEHIDAFDEKIKEQNEILTQTESIDISFFEKIVQDKTDELNGDLLSLVQLQTTQKELKDRVSILEEETDQLKINKDKDLEFA